MAVIRNFLSFGIQKKIITIVVASVCLSIGITTWINYTYLSDTLEQNAGEKISQIADRTAEMVRSDIENEYQFLRAIAVSPYTISEISRANEQFDRLSTVERAERVDLLDKDWSAQSASIESLIQEIETSELSQYLRDLQKTDPREVEIFVTNKFGFNIAMSNRTSDYYQADEEWWQRASKGTVYISEPNFDESSQRWAINFGIPILEDISAGDVTGVVRGTGDITTLLDGILNINFGETGRGYFVGTDGTIYHRQGNTLELHTAPADYLELLGNFKEGWERNFFDSDGETNIASVRSVSYLGRPIGWIIVLMKESELKGIVLSTLQENVLSALILIIVLGFIGSLTSTKILRILQTLRKDVHKLSVGDYSDSFSKTVTSTSDPDIISLVDGFNKMKIAVQSRENAILESERKYRHLTETMAEGLAMVDRQGRLTLFNPRILEMTGYSRNEMLGKSFFAFFTADEQPDLATQWVSRMVGFKSSYESTLLTKKGGTLPVLISARSLMDENNIFTGSLAVITDISARKKSEMALKKKIMELASFRKVDNAILTRSTLKEVVQTILDQFRHELGADAASLHIFYSQSTRIRLSRAFIDDKDFKCGINEILFDHIHAHNEDGSGTLYQTGISEQILWKKLAESEFKSLYIAPILSGDRLKGFIEVAFRTPLVVNDEWLSYFNGLITQTAVGIEKTELFEKLQTRNKELKQAYLSAIQGWAKALELRDEETKGHSERVVQMAVEMAEQFGIKGDELDTFRNGALLHDIGKMGVPDSILLKPGKLTDEEWLIMKKHPTFAYRLLKEIPFLKDAFEIPYYHHERWNGSGYPHGLKGTDIPLAARIFAVVDVWDALTNDRPYRKAWSMEDTTRYLQENQGILFDPEVVNTFLAFLATGKIQTNKE